jgi:cytochrome b pre-mRNA-processing protein 3
MNFSCGGRSREPKKPYVAIALGDAAINMEMRTPRQGAQNIGRRAAARSVSKSPDPMPSSPSFLQRLFGRTDAREGLRPLYHAIVAEGRQPHWYLDGAVPDTLDGRFDMIVAILAQMLIRLEQLGAAQDSVWLTELFVDDMDGQLRQEGIGDVVVGKHVGRMMSALGGRISAYRDALTGEADFAVALRRNLYRGQAVGDDAVAHVEGALRTRWTRLGCLTRDALLAGDIG